MVVGGAAFEVVHVKLQVFHALDGANVTILNANQRSPKEKVKILFYVLCTVPHKKCNFVDQ